MSGVLQILRKGSIPALAALMLVGCKSITQVESRGYIETSPIAEEIEVGKTDKSDVRRLLGSPSTISAFPPETWYYINREREIIGFFEPELSGQAVAQIEFDEAGRVSKFKQFGLEEAQDLQYVERETPTEGRSLGLFEQLLGNLGRYNTPRDATQSRQ